MSMSALVRALGAAAGGISQGLRDAEDAERRKKKDAREEEDRAYLLEQREREKKTREGMAAAAAPVAVETVQPAGPVMPGAEGAAGQPLAPVSRVQGKAYDTAEAAQAAADEANTPQAQTARMADVAMRSGNPALAQQLRTGGMQERLGQFQLNAAQRADLDARFNDDLQSKVNSWDTFDQFTSESAGDGFGGKLKLQSVPSADGKIRVVNVVAPDGSLKPTGRVFPNTSEGLELAKAELSKISPEKKLQHLYQQAQLAQQRAQLEATTQHQAAVLGETTRHNKATEGHQARMETLARARGAGGGSGQPGGMTLADLKDGHKTIATTLNADYKTQIEAEMDPAKAKAIKTARESEIATVQKLYTGAMQAGFALTPEQAIAAFRSGETATQEFKKRDGTGTVKVRGVMFQGKFIPMADNPGATVEPKPAPAPAAASAPAPVAGSAAPAPPSRLATAVKGGMQAMADEGQQYEAIRARVRQADNGGTPLTPEERATARKFGIAPVKG